MPDDIHQPAPDVFAAARTRRSIRAYKPLRIAPDILREIVALGIGRGDHAKSKAYRAGNYNFFGAPAGLIFTIDRKLERGSWLDYGMFLQTIMLAARARGLHTCAEAAIASFPDVVRRELDITPDNIVICGMAMGYANTEAVVNTFRPPRIAVDEYAVFLD